VRLGRKCGRELGWARGLREKLGGGIFRCEGKNLVLVMVAVASRGSGHVALVRASLNQFEPTLDSRNSSTEQSAKSGTV